MCKYKWVNIYIYIYMLGIEFILLSIFFIFHNHISYQTLKAFIISENGTEHL